MVYNILCPCFSISLSFVFYIKFVFIEAGILQVTIEQGPIQVDDRNVEISYQIIVDIISMHTHAIVRTEATTFLCCLGKQSTFGKGGMTRNWT